MACGSRKKTLSQRLQDVVAKQQSEESRTKQLSRRLLNLFEQLKSKLPDFFQISITQSVTEQTYWIEIVRKTCDIHTRSGAIDRAFRLLFSQNGDLILEALCRKFQSKKIDDVKSWEKEILDLVQFFGKEFVYCPGLHEKNFEGVMSNIPSFPASVIHDAFPIDSYRSKICQLWFRKVRSTVYISTVIFGYNIRYRGL